MDREAAGNLANQFSWRLISYVRGLMGPAMQRRFDAEDIVQSALKSFFKQEELPESVKELQTLLFYFTKCKLAKRFRDTLAAKRTPLREESPMNDPSQDRQVPWEAADQQWGPEEEAIWKELERLRDQWWDRLSPLQKSVIELNEEGIPQQEIAQRVRRADRSVRRMLREAEDELRDLLDLGRRKDPGGGAVGGPEGLRPGF